MKKSLMVWTLVLLALFLVYTCACMMIDVSVYEPIYADLPASDEPVTAKIGFSSLNLAARNWLGYRYNFYMYSKYLGYLGLLTAAAIGVMWLYELIKRGGVGKIDSCLNGALVALALTAVFYVLFEVLKLNFRPVIRDTAKGLEASYPSTHTLIGCVVFGSAAMVAGGKIKDKGLARSVKVLCAVLAVLTFGFRALSGVHWLSDIVGGIILSLMILSCAREVAYLQDVRQKK